MLAILDGGITLLHLAPPALTILGALAIGWVVELILLNRLARLAHLAARTPWQGSDIFVRSLRGKIVFWSLLYGVYLARPTLDAKQHPNGLWAAFTTRAIQPFTAYESNIVVILLVIFVASLTFWLAGVSAQLIHSSTRPDARPALSIVTNIVRVTIFIIGALIILALCNISVAPALAALGVTGLAASLALQATLTDLVSGVQLTAARQVQVGNYIKLSTGEEGYVTDITWRTTTVRRLDNNMVIIPNSKMTSTILTNYYEPVKEMAVLLEVVVSYRNDLDHVERVTVEVANDIMRTVPGGVPDNEPFIRYGVFREIGVEFTVILRGQEFTDQYLIKHEFIKRLTRRYREEDIELASPVQTVYLRDAASAEALPVASAAR